MPIAPVLLAAESVGTSTNWLTPPIQPGTYEYFAVVLRGTHSGAPVIAETDFGRMRLSEASRDLVNVDGQRMRQVWGLYGGNQRQVFTASGAAEWMTIIPRGFLDDNVHRVLPGDNAQFNFNFVGNWAARIATATWRLYGLIAQTGKMRYALKIIQYDFNLPAGTAPQNLTDENVIACYIERDTDIDNSVIKQDQETASTFSQIEDLSDISDALRQTDSLATANTEAIANFNTAICAVEFARYGGVTEFLSDAVSLELNLGAADTISVVVYSADFSPNKLRQTMVESAATVQRKFRRKNTLGRTRPIETIKLEAEGVPA